MPSWEWIPTTISMPFPLISQPSKDLANLGKEYRRRLKDKLCMSVEGEGASDKAKKMPFVRLVTCYNCRCVWRPVYSTLRGNIQLRIARQEIPAAGKLYEPHISRAM